MTKVIALRVTVASDDGVKTEDVKLRLAAMIAERGTELLGDNGGSNRVHWSSCEVLQGPERAMLRGKGRRGGAIAQPELLMPS